MYDLKNTSGGFNPSFSERIPSMDSLESFYNEVLLEKKLPNDGC